MLLGAAIGHSLALDAAIGLVYGIAIALALSNLRDRMG